MKKIVLILALLFPLTLLANNSETADSAWMVENYTKNEVYITMRDGKRLYTTIYEPKDHSTMHPILMNRTPYSVAPYGAGKFKAFWKTHYMEYIKRNYIIVLQDVRGRMMSEGTFEDVRPYNPHKSGKQIDEASDTYDTIDWLIKNVRSNNGNVGIWGISYPGFYATMGAMCGHPALKAASPQAPVTEWFLGDDFHHNGAFMQMDGFNFYSSFGKPRPQPTENFGGGFKYYTKDNYKFYLEAGTLKNLATLMGDSIRFWNELYQHPNYDSWWQSRNARSHVNVIPNQTATLVVGGLFDAEDCYGAWNLYKAIEKKANNNNKLVMGPWKHGGWARGDGHRLGNVRFGKGVSEWYQQHIEIPYFEYYLNGKGSTKDIAEANIFYSGSNEWKAYKQWPPAEKKDKPIYLHADGQLTFHKPEAPDYKGYTEYISDPAKPVPYAEGVHFKRTAEYMTDDQRFAARRPDVITFSTDVLKNDLTLAGPVVANLFASISTTDADFVVKLIDVFPDDFTYDDSKDGEGPKYIMGGYQMLVRGEIMRGKYRKSFEHPTPFIKDAITEVSFTLPDVAHVFRKGHRLMIQIQSSWFPLADRNPQQFVNIYQCNESDFIPARIRIFSSNSHASNIVLPVME